MLTDHARRRSAIGKGVIAAVAIIIIVVAAVGAYYAYTVTSSTTTSTATSTATSTLTSTSTSTATSTAISTTISTVTSTSVSTLVPSQMLSLTFSGVPVGDPAKGSDEASSAAFVNLYDTLVYPTASGNVEPDLATSWTVSSDGLTYTFTIRQGVTFHNGDPLNASDVAFSMNRLLTIGQGFAYIFTPYVASTAATGPYTVVFHLQKTFGPFISALVRLYIVDQKQVMAHIASGIYGANGDYGSTWLLTHDAGSGPYSMYSANLESNMIFQEYPSYWNGTMPNQPKFVNYIGVSEPSTTQALFASGEIQITDQWQEYSTIAQLAQLPNAKMAIIGSGLETYLMMNTQKAPTDDKYVRQALAYALNYTAIIDNVFPGSSLAAGPVPTNLPGHDPTLPTSQQNLPKALQLIKESKYYSSLASYPISLYWVTVPAAEQKLALEFASDAAKIGVTVDITGVPWDSVVADLSNETTSPNIVCVNDVASYLEAGSLLQARYTTPAEGTWEQNEWLHNATLDNLIYSAVGTVNQTQRFQKYYSIEWQIYNAQYSIFVFDNTEVRAYYPSVVNWYAANGHPIPLDGYDFFWRDVSFYPQALTSLFSG